jgi:hypothetical protein
METLAAAAVLSAMLAAGAPAATDWSGRYEAGEAAGPGMVRSYTADVFRDSGGEWRAFVGIDGHMTYRRLAARGVVKADHLVLLFVRPGHDDMGQIESHAVDDPLFTIERGRRGAFFVRLGKVSSLLDVPNARLEASRKPLPDWAGEYEFGRDSAEVTLEDDGWHVALIVAGESIPAYGEEGESISEGHYLHLMRRGATGRAAAKPLAKMLRGKDGVVRLVIGSRTVEGRRAPPSK